MYSVISLTLFMAIVQSVLGQGCTRVFGRFQPTVFQQGEPKSELEIANAALQELCAGACTLNFDIPEICPIVALSIESSAVSGFAFLPTYEMSLLATGKDLISSNLYKIQMTFDFNEFSGDVYIQDFSYVEQQQTITQEDGVIPESVSTPALASRPTTNNSENMLQLYEPEPELEFDIGTNLLDEIDEVISQDQFVKENGGGVSPFMFVLGDLDSITVQVNTQGE